MSIVTPTLNQADYIRQTIESVARQSYNSIEHIVVDGGSSDGTLGILESEPTPRLRWLSEPDQGMYDAINKGLRLARGDILGYLNSDDLLLPWAVAAAVEAFDHHDELSLVYGDALRYYEELDEFDVVLQPPYRFPILARTGSFVQPAVFWRRSAMTKVGLFDARLRLSADLDYWLRMARAGPVGQIDEVLAIERVHAGGQTARLNDRLRREATEVRGRYHRDHRSRLFRKVGARLVAEVAVRGRMLRLAAATLMQAGAWPRAREQLRPRIRPLWFLHALVTPRPLVGTPVRSLRMRLLRGRWLAFAARPTLPAKRT